MEFKINGKDYDLKFGLRFIRELDNRYKVDYQGLKFGMGVNLAFMGLNQYNPTTLTDIIQASVAHEKSAPKLFQTENAIEEYAEENEGLEQLFEDVLDEMGKSYVVKDSLKKFKEEAQTDPIGD